MEQFAYQNRQKPKITREVSAGGVIYNPRLDKFLLIKDSYSRWALPKGKLEENETPAQAAAREISEEVGLTDLTLKERLGKIHYYYKSAGKTIFKEVHLFLFETQDKNLKPLKKEIKGARWLTREIALKKYSYKKSLYILKKANHYVLEKRRKNARERGA